MEEPLHHDVKTPRQKFTDWAAVYLTTDVLVPLALMASVAGFILYIWVIPALCDEMAFWGVHGEMITASPEKTPPTMKSFPFAGAYGTIFTHKGHYIITPVADYTIEARVLHTRHYYSTANAADLIPYDIALGWERMSEPYALRHYFIFHHSNVGGRILWVIPRGNYEDTPADYLNEAMTGVHFSNNHIIPLNDAVYDKIGSMRAGDHVRLTGYLVNIASTENKYWHWTTTKYDRTDTAKNFYWGEAGEPTCDTMFVTDAKIYSI